MRELLAILFDPLESGITPPLVIQVPLLQLRGARDVVALPRTIWPCASSRVEPAVSACRAARASP